jgi:hypothetical protein
MKEIMIMTKERNQTVVFFLPAALLLFVWAFIQPCAARAQWTTSGNNISNTNTGNVGIGTAAPYNKLEIAGTGSTISFAPGPANGLGANAVLNRILGRSNYGAVDGSSAAEIKFLTGRTNWWTGQIAFYTNGVDSTNSVAVERMRIDNNGNVGIGTTNPTSRLHVVSGTDSATSVLHLDTGTHGGTSMAVFGTANNESGFDLSVYRAGQYFSRFGVDNFGRMYLQPGGGNVGVGTSAPAYKFDVQGGQINASGGLCIAGDCKTAWSQIGGSGSSQWTTGGTNIYYNTGNIGIGTVTPTSAKLVISGSAGTEGLDLSTADQYANLRVIRNSNSSFDKDLYLQFQAGTGSKIHFYSNNAETMTLSSGNVGIGTTSPTAKLDVNGDINVTGNINAKFQDIAEWVPATHALPAGTVVTLNPTQTNQVTASSTAYDTRVAGVVSERPGLALGEAGKDKVLVATTGRVKVKVDASRAPIHIGDLLVTSEKEGVAMKSEPLTIQGRSFHSPGTLIGKALEPLEKGTGEILVLLSLQ